jgi:hypothetical protein
MDSRGMIRDELLGMRENPTEAKQGGGEKEFTTPENRRKGSKSMGSATSM